MRKAAALAAALVLTPNELWYCWQVWQGRAHPTLMTWILFCVAVSISFATYWSTPDHSIVNNIGNVMDLAGVWLVLLFTMTFGHELQLGFNKLETACLAASLAILVYWRLTRKHTSANLSIQAIMVIAYFPTIYRLWNATSTTEPLRFWVITWIGAVLIVIPAVIARDKLATVYSLRALVMVSVVVIMIVRLLV